MKDMALEELVADATNPDNPERQTAIDLSPSERKKDSVTPLRLLQKGGSTKISVSGRPEQERGDTRRNTKRTWPETIRSG
jgi:hypothetical protein